jgi:hypothetical protein
MERLIYIYNSLFTLGKLNDFDERDNFTLNIKEIIYIQLRNG